MNHVAGLQVARRLDGLSVENMKMKLSRETVGH